MNHVQTVLQNYEAKTFGGD